MKSELVNSVNGDYLKVELAQVNQKGLSIYLGIIKARDFLKIFTVRPAKYDILKNSSLANSFPEEKDYYNHLIDGDVNNIGDRDFQRDPNDDRINKITTFLNEEEYSLFPNTIIANCELINDFEDYEITDESSERDFLELRNKPPYLSFLKKHNEESFALYIPYQQDVVLVIDGQHRLEGLKQVGSHIQDNFDLIIAFIVGFDRSVIAKQFYTINYEQKPVNKSLLYQLTGEFSKEIDEISFLHNIVKLLNELTESPFYGRVKMLGSTPKNYPAELRQLLSISQAFLIDSMIRFVSKNSKNTLYPPIFLPYYKDQSQHILIVRIIARFFNAVKEIKPEWANPETSVLSKGMGVAALLKILNFIFPKILKDKLNGEWHRINEITIKDYVTALQGLEHVDFKNTGPYGKTGSAGNISKIKNDILANLVIFGSPDDIREFEKNFKITYLDLLELD
jgi:DGQHR domain-containing protein